MSVRVCAFIRACVCALRGRVCVSACVRAFVCVLGCERA